MPLSAASAATVVPTPRCRPGAARLRLAAGAAPSRARPARHRATSTATPSTPRSRSATIHARRQAGDRRRPPARRRRSRPATWRAPSGCASAMPMFEARRLCPRRPWCGRTWRNIRASAAQVRALMLRSRRWSSRSRSTRRLSILPAPSGCTVCRPPRRCAICRRVESELGITVSIGLSCNKFLAKIAFGSRQAARLCGLGAVEAPRSSPTSRYADLRGRQGRRSATRSRRLPHRRRSAARQRGRADAPLRQRRPSPRTARARHRRSQGQRRPRDQELSRPRPRSIRTSPTSVRSSALWSLAEKVSARLKGKALAGATVTLKLKTADFRIRTRAQSLAAHPLAGNIFAAARDLLGRETDGTRFRLLGIGAAHRPPSEPTCRLRRRPRGRGRAGHRPVACPLRRRRRRQGPGVRRTRMKRSPVKGSLGALISSGVEFAVDRRNRCSRATSAREMPFS